LFVLENKLNARTRGGEVSIAAELTKAWRVRAMYAHLHKRLSFDPGSTDVTSGAAEGNDPKQHWTLVSSWDLPRRWEFELLLRRVSALPMPVVPAYTELDARIGWQPWPAWEFALVGQNLLESRHLEFGTARALERSVYGKVTWRF
jgi:iron complex outermembrane receptor protein